MKNMFAITAMATVAMLFALPLPGVRSATAADNPPISQPLVREGTLAVKLVGALGLGTTSNEAEAESTLAAVGIAPRNGWIADYPVTPDIVGELQQATGEAADSNRIAIGKDEALNAFQDVMVAYNLSIRPSEATDNSPYYDSEDPTIVNNYYYDEGPPVVTYYAPPPDYYYLYTWVPYPFWWWDFWFPGFFILADFDVDIHGHHHRHHERGEHGEFVSNHFRDSRTGGMVRIDPAHRVGATFASEGGAGWSSPSVRNSAQAIFNKSRSVAVAEGSGTVSPAGSRMVSGRPLQNKTFTSTPARSAISSAPSEKGFNAPSVQTGASRSSWGGNRTFSASSGSGRTFSSPSVGSRTFSMGRTAGGMGSFGGFSRR